MPKLMTFHAILPGCEEGNPEAWRTFLATYSSLAAHVFGVYSGFAPDQCEECWRDALPALTANGGDTLKGLSHQSEREFLVGLRAWLMEGLANRLDPARDAASPPAPSVATLGVLLSGLPLIHQEVAFLALAGNSQGSIERILRMTPAVAGEGLARLGNDFATIVERDEDRCLWPSAWIAICRAARAGEQNDCTPLRQLIRILDGQASWYDKTPAEEHRAKCLHCLELWTSLLEVVAWDHTRQLWPAEKVEPLMAAVPLRQGNRRPSLLARVFGSHE